MTLQVDFPRGQGNQTRAKVKRPSDRLFKTDKAKKKKKEVIKPTNDDEDDLDVKVTITRLTIPSLPIHAVIIGCIQNISDYELTLVIPAGIVVAVPIFNISASYSEIMEEFMSSGSNQPVKPQSMFKCGQFLAVKIMDVQEPKSVGQKYQITGSINPEDVNANIVIPNLKSFASNIVIAASVESIEDHGVVMDLGMGWRMKGFLPDTETQQVMSRLGVKKLAIGTVFMCAGVSVRERVLKLTASENEIGKKVIVGDEGILAASTLTPGSRVSAVIMDTNDRGLVIVAGNEHKGYVRRDYLKSEWDLAKENYSIGDNITVTVLFVHPLTNVVVCSLRSLSDTRHKFKELSDYKTGQLVKSATVVHIDDQNCVILKSKKKIKLVATPNHLKDTHIEELSIRDEFPIGSKHDARTIRTSVFDAMIKVSLKPSLVGLETADVDDVQVGSVMKGKVAKMTDRGLLINLGFHLNVFVRKFHLSDSPHVGQKNPEKMFPLEKEVRVRILCVDRESSDHPNLIGTCKKTLINLPDSQVLDSISKAVPDFVTRGVVVQSSSAGLLIEFFNGISGFVSHFFLQEYSKLETDFPIGKLVSVKVMSADVTSNRINLCLSTQDGLQMLQRMKEERKAKAAGEKIKSSESGIERTKDGKTKEDERLILKERGFSLGSIVDARVERLSGDGLFLRLLLQSSATPHQAHGPDGDHALQHNELTTGETTGLKDSGITAVVPFVHMTDSQSTCPKHASRLFPLGKLVKCRLFSVSKTPIRGLSQPPYLVATLKPTLMNPLVPTWAYHSSLRPESGRMWNQNIGIAGLRVRDKRVVEFVGGLTGLLKEKDAALFVARQRKVDAQNKNKTKGKHVVQTGQLLPVKITNVDAKARTMELSVMTSIAEFLTQVQQKSSGQQEDETSDGAKRKRFDSNASLISLASDLPIGASILHLLSSDDEIYDNEIDMEKRLKRGFDGVVKETTSNSRKSAIQKSSATETKESTANSGLDVDVNPDIRLIAGDFTADCEANEKEKDTPSHPDSQAGESGLNEDPDEEDDGYDDEDFGL